MRPATKTQLAQIGDICRRRGIPVPNGIKSMTREDGDRLVRALLYIDGETGPRGRMPGVEMEVDLDLVHQLEASREEKRMETPDKTCSRCKQTKLPAEFGSNKSTPDGLSYYCKECNRELYRERKAKKKRRSEPEPSFTPADEDLDLPAEKAPGPHWCLAELRDPRLSTIQQAQKILVAKFGDVGFQDTAEVLEQIAGLDLA